MGVFFGIAVNLLEGRFYFHIWEDHRKEYGAAAYGIATNIVIFLIMLCSDILTTKFNIIVPFMFFGVTLLLMPLFIRKFK
jgi:cobalamin biosynthesis protein CobD/CbiB